ncbi:N-succinyldiaminopimelate aminotransferase [Bifidobacterium dolichotidis]|uniref:N-succinyldiaminopimelate aminotransferase n=1 Tax=Bifidobacterium dolichotidis TaxID=2306976 RepID=A0A430FQA7_9BIFI|nr:succinyldiaminopimelate transaminase [Bifidobacterium dolichotidis]RSX54996.1 N-succinyldiaminopimelate aminotransferase [Bifidobacterium dolichotidis]
MGFHRFHSPYDWSRIATYKGTAQAVPGGMIDLSVGSPVDPVPQSVQDALAEASADTNAHGYPATVGTAALRTALAQWFKQCRGVPDLQAIDADIVPTVGSKEAVALMASLLFLGEGDVVVQPRVSYPTYEIGTQLAGAQVLKVDHVADVDTWRHVPGVKAIWVNSPNNPTGEVLSAEQLTVIIEAARSIGAVVLSDECYALMDWNVENQHAMTMGDAPVASPCALNPAICKNSAQNVLVLYSLSKQSNMAGYRTAVIAGDAEIIKTMTQYRKQIGQIIPGPVQAAMAAGLEDVTAVRVQYERYRRRLEILTEALQQYGYEASMPQGALYVWVPAKTVDCWSDMAELAKLGILPSPGEFYGDARYLRFSATASDEQIDQAAERLKGAARQNREARQSH